MWDRKCQEINTYIGVGSVLKHGNLLQELEHQEKKVYTYR